MNKRYVVLFLLAVSLAVLISGCGEKEEEFLIEAFIGGSQGMVIEFLENAPPAEVFDLESPFDVSIKLENIGEWDIENPEDVTVTISGIDPVDFGKDLAFLTRDVTLNMKGRHPDPLGGIIQGTIDVVDFQGLQYQESVIGKVDFGITPPQICSIDR